MSLEFLREKLGCSEYELEGAVERAEQLYPEIREVKVFERFRHLYHASMPEEVLRKAVKAKEDYIRVYGGQRARIGHNWEACVEWFIDKFTTGAEFGVDTPEGRQIKSGVIGVFAGSAFNDKKKIMLKDETVIGLPSYAARMNIKAWQPPARIYRGDM